jgi:hypothetical protein
MTDYLVSNYDLENISFAKPKKNGSDYLISKVKYSGNDFFIQFPKMKIASEQFSKNVELEFSSNSKYSKELYQFLSKLDEHILAQISEKSEDWFGKIIPRENINKMYNKFIKAPKELNNNCTMNFNVKKCELLDKKNNVLDISEYSLSLDVECIVQLKYIVFSKDSSFTYWEIHTAKLHKKINKVKQYGFIEPEEESESDTEEELSFTFFN